jgi:DNA-binding NtrC family response regulator
VEGRRKGLTGLSPEARDAVAAYPWPGNVRELKNVMERGVLLSTGQQVGLSDLGLGAPAGANGEVGAAWLDLPYRKAHDEFERIYLERALKAAGGNVSRAATRMGVDRTGLHAKLRKYGLTGRD